MSTIDSASSLTSTAGTSQTVTKAANQMLGKDEFLKLLTTELRNQNPLQPMDNKDFIAQMAQFSSLEQMNNVAESVDKLSNSLTSMYQQSLLTQGAALIGKLVSGIDSTTENSVQGIVDSVRWVDGKLELQIGETALGLDDVTEVTNPKASL